MKSWRGIPVLLTIVTLAWHGVLLTLPHDHHEADVARDVPGCALAGTASHTHHVHGLPSPLPPRHCLACLAGHAIPLFRGRATYAVPPPAAHVAMAAPPILAVHAGAVLPGRRGPPASA